MELPPLYRIRQEFDRERVENIPAAVSSELGRIRIETRARPGQTVALTVGSRGIANLPLIIRSAASELKRLGLRPFIIPAMGSHGGATAAGQEKVLAHYGISEASVGVPVRSSMDVIRVGETTDGVPVVIDRLASEADWIGVINRVKPHTRFRGDIESGLAKMFLIGLGKAEGARIYHRAEVHLSFRRLIETAVPLVLRQCRILFGLGIIENGYDETARLAAAGPEEIFELEKELLADAKRRMPRLPFQSLDVVVVDQIGKNLSGTGMDTNIVGVKSGIEIKRIYARDLHPASEGNATGVGIAHMVHRRLVRRMDARATYMNCLTSLGIELARIPMTFDTDREALEAALTTIGLTPPPQARLCWIANTLELSEIWASEACLKPSSTALHVEAGPFPMTFDNEGQFVPFPGMFH
ncbi:MAG: DUF2088 domain-containing protein [Planctomycetes bacterium]|nr:DUF2088 domain-containing protein [Planctomycetota bacterium]